MDFQTDVIITLQTGTPGFTNLMALVSLLGVPEFYLVVIPFILWCYDKKLGMRILFLLSISTVANILLKILFHTPRPYWINGKIQALASEPTFGMPSGHAQSSLVFLGCLGAYFKKRYVWAICITGILLASVARLYLGVHFLTDILTGWAVGFLILLLFMRYEDACTDWFMKKTIQFRICSAFFASFIVIPASYLILLSHGTWQIPPEWFALSFAQSHERINPLTLRDTIMASGILCGTGLGAIISAEYFPYAANGSLPRKIVRYILGISILFVFWVLVSAVTKTPDLTGYTISYLRAASVGIWITVGAPFLFYKVGLLNKG